MSWSGVLAIPSRAPGCLRTIILWYRALQGKTIMSARFPATGIIIILEIPSQASGCLHTESVIYVLGNNITSTRFSFTQNQLCLQYVLDNTVTSTRFPAHRINMSVFQAIPSHAPQCLHTESTFLCSWQYHHTHQVTSTHNQQNQ